MTSKANTKKPESQTVLIRMFSFNIESANKKLFSDKKGINDRFAMK